ncbi:MAG: peptide deformylase [Oscillospiraceae bacterium]|nr:peptide deformylase [Oscillospiraceae bacterium]
MAIRKIITKEFDVLKQVCEPVTEFDDKLMKLLDDMCETLEDSKGVGLAAPQVGVLKRIFIMSLGDGFIECINPEIVKESGKQRVLEGCLSCPDDWGYVVRPAKVKLKAQNRKGKYFILNLTELGAQCASHENDHLDGKLFVEKIVERVNPEDFE